MFYIQHHGLLTVARNGNLEATAALGRTPRASPARQHWPLVTLCPVFFTMSWKDSTVCLLPLLRVKGSHQPRPCPKAHSLITRQGPYSLCVLEEGMAREGKLRQDRLQQMGGMGGLSLADFLLSLEDGLG